MTKRIFSALQLLILFLVLLTCPAYSQTTIDSVQKLQEVVVKAYLSEQPLLRLPSSVSVVDSRQLRSQPGITLLPALNAVPGLRMEERSPGSYRLSIRGSLLRSPFGIRNIKVYMDDFPLTDAGGNTYLNLIDVESINSMEVLKGPDGSLFGANSGGVIIVNPANRRADSSGASANVSLGSFNLLQEKLNIQRSLGKHFFQLTQTYQKSDGYRENSALNRHYGLVRYNWSYSPGNQLRALAFYSDMDYQTPGGLTESQYDTNPRSARPATAVVPGAIEQHAGIFNKTLFTGLLNESQVSKQLRHIIAVFGSHTDFKNPFITNYEIRDETTAGIRTYLELNGNTGGRVVWKANTGIEWQQTTTDISNYDNNAGERGAIQSSDELSARQYFYFTRFSATIFNRLNVEVASSINHYRFEFGITDLQSVDHVSFKPQLMPRFALSYQFSENLAWRNSVSRGYSPPTVAELRSSDQLINTGLRPESGWNYETGIRTRSNSDRIWLDASVFYYKLQDAIVRRVNADDSEFFLNAGGTRQLGFESQVSAWLIAPSEIGIVRGLQIRNSVTLNNFKFRNYQNGVSDYSGNRLTGVPDRVVVSSADITLPSSFGFFIQHNHTTKIPINDMNSAFADGYNLVQLKFSWRRKISSKSNIECFLSVDNLLNQKYSLGNDLNAFGGRYYNAAPFRNFYGGIKANFSSL